ncbi:MAG: transcription termination/antitermination protein NusA, partial [Phenylobacterium sp.]|nr:transcription termination/antitermination protein NusA [Phenylobacterium sp.]
RVREPGILEAFGLEPQDAELLIMRARIAMGWVEAPEEPEAEYEEPSDEAFAEAEAAGEAQDA